MSTSKGVSDLRKHTDANLALVRANAPTVAARAAEALAPRARRADTESAASLLLGQLVDLCDARMTAVESADHKVKSELADDAPWYAQRESSLAATRASLIKIKALVDPLYGASITKKLHLAGATSHDPVVVESDATRAAAALRETRLPKPQDVGVSSVNATAWADALSTAVAGLTEANKQLKLEAAELQASHRAKDDALVALNDALIALANVALGLARLGGTGDLLAGLRGTLDDGETASTEPSTPTPDAPTP